MPYVRLVVIVACVVLPGCAEHLPQHSVTPTAAPRLTLKDILNQYNVYPTNKALAVARDDNGAWASGWSWNQQSEQQAMTRALAQCTLFRPNFRVAAPCQLYAVNDQIVSQAHSASPYTDARVATEQARVATEQARLVTEQIERKYGTYVPPRTQGTSLPPPAPRPALSSGEEIPLVKVGGVYELPVEINGVLTLNFVFDSGAAEVNVPADVVLTLVRTGTITGTDFLPGKTYTLADGSQLSSPRFVIRSLKIGHQSIPNVSASVGNINSGLLIGQSLLGKLGIWGVDTQRQVLIVSPR